MMKLKSKKGFTLAELLIVIAIIAIMVAIAIPLLLVATWLGNKLQKRISQATFIKVTYVLLTVIGIILLVK